MLEPFNADGLSAMNAAGLTGFALEARRAHHAGAEAWDVLSSQANIAGYKAVLLAANTYGRLLPMMMTAGRHDQGGARGDPRRRRGRPAGDRHRQAARRGDRASDVRPAVKEQIESLGAKFIDVPYETDEEREIAKGVGGYARPMPAAWIAEAGGGSCQAHRAG